jgi:hypothetical protein
LKTSLDRIINHFLVDGWCVMFHFL